MKSIVNGRKKEKEKKVFVISVNNSVTVRFGPHFLPFFLLLLYTHLITCVIFSLNVAGVLCPLCRSVMLPSPD